MFRFGNKKRLSFGEKKSYFTTIVNDNSQTIKRRNWAARNLLSLRQKKSNIKQGDVFIVDDRKFGNPNKKPRQVVIAKVDNINDKVTLLPVKKYKKIIPLSKFDGNRRLNVDDKIKVKIDSLYELRGFKNTKNSKLTINEKDKLKQKLNRYIP